ncbi:MAG: hypothetical protein R3C05_24540 [Pirellulaceae bacterium]
MTHAIYRSKQDSPGEPSEQPNSRPAKKRRAYLLVVLTTCAIYGGFVARKFVQVSASTEPAVDLPLSDVKLQQKFDGDAVSLSNEAYLQAAELADAELLDKLREKNRPQDLRLHNPRAYWHQRIIALEKQLEDLKSDNLYESPFGSREQQRLKNIKSDKPSY